MSAVAQALTVAADWVARYAEDGTALTESGVSQGVLDRDSFGDADPAGHGNERSLVGFTVTLPADADIFDVRLQTRWTDWLYPQGIGSLWLGWHSHPTPPTRWYVGHGDAQLSDHDIRDQLVDLRLSWASWAVVEDGFAGIAVGPAWNTGGLYAGSTTADLSEWVLQIQYLSSEVT